MKWSEFEEEVEEDFTIRKDQLKTKIYEIPKLHSKYLRHYYREKNKLIELEASLQLLYKKKWDYYKNDYDHLIDDKHIPWHIESDKEYVGKMILVNRQKNIVDYFSQLIKKCNSLSFELRAIIDYMKFENGIN